MKVYRMILYQGPPGWIKTTLEKSLPEGITTVSHPHNKETLKTIQTKILSTEREKGEL